MKRFSIIGFVIIVLGVVGAVFYVNQDGTTTETYTRSEGEYTGKKVFYVDSYHSGYAWSDGLNRGILDVFADTGIELEIFKMDSKRNADEVYIKSAALEAKAKIESFQPDVLVVSDDNAFKYLIMPYYRDADMPVVFSGLNWDATVYGAPYTNTTGMIEVSLTKTLIEELEKFAEGERLGFLSSNSMTEHKTLENYKTILGLEFEKAYLVGTMEEWKQAYLALQEEVDVVIIENNAGISDWDDEEAEKFVLENMRVPSGTTNVWMGNVVLIGLTKIPEEQGEWSANTTLDILSGKKPSEIPLVKNEQGGLIVNFRTAEKLGVSFSPETIKAADNIIK